MSYLLIIITNVVSGYFLFQIVKNGKERFQEQDERMKLIENEFCSLYKKMKTKND